MHTYTCVSDVCVLKYRYDSFHFKPPLTLNRNFPTSSVRIFKDHIRPYMIDLLLATT
jgi:hypothetical protein